MAILKLKLLYKKKAEFVNKILLTNSAFFLELVLKFLHLFIYHMNTSFILHWLHIRSYLPVIMNALLSLFGNINLIWLSFPIAEIASITTAIVLCKKIYKHIDA